MANRDAARGLVPIIHPASDIRTYPIDAAEVVARYTPVAINSDGEITETTAGATNVIAGSIVGIYGSDGMPATVCVSNAASGNTALVCMANDEQEFLIQGDGAGTALAATDRGARTNLVSNGIVAAVGRSTAEADEDCGADATYQLQVIDLDRRVNNAWGANADVRVKVNLPQNAPSTAGI